MSETQTKIIKTKRHMCQSVQGWLNLSPRDQRRSLKYTTRDDGTPFGGVAELRQIFIDAKERGYRVLPICECDNFDYQRGCLGHPIVILDKEIK